MTEFEKLLEDMPEQNVSLPSNTIAHIFRHDQKENFISDWLAFLINPEFTGSIQPITALLELALDKEPSELSDITICREYTFNDNRRIDLYIETSQYIIGVENKIWSGLQPEQLKDYREQLVGKASSEEKELILILLCPKNNSLSDSSKDELEKFKLVVYEDLVAEFKKIRLNIFENLRATVLMEDFILHMEEYIMNNSDKRSLDIDLAMWRFEDNYRDKLNKLENSLKESKTLFRKYIENRLIAVVKDRKDFEDWETNSAANYFQLYKRTWKNLQVHFELFYKGTFVPKKIQVFLHTRELKKEKRTDVLRNLQYVANSFLMNKNEFEISYENEESFERSITKIFDALNKIVNEYTEKIDTEIVASSKL